MPAEALDEYSLSKRGIPVDTHPSMSHPEAAQDGEHIELTIPARPEYIVIARLAAGGVAGRMGLSFDEAEDLKLAVGEVCTAAIRSGATKVTVRFRPEADRLDIRVAHTRGRAQDASDPTQERELGMFLVRCLMDEVRVRNAGAQHAVLMTKRLRS